MRKLLRIFRRLLIWTFVIGVILIASAIGLAIYFEDDVKEAIITEINKNLKTEIKVEEINLSLLDKFPYASLTFNKVSANEVSASKTKNELIVADKIYLQFNIFDLIDKKYRIKRIEIKDGEIFIHIFKDKSANYEIWKQKEGKQDSDFSFELQKFILNNVKLKFQNDFAQQDYSFKANKAYLKGNFDEKHYGLALNGDFDFEYLKSNKVTYLNEDKVNLDLLFNVDNEKNLYKIQKGKATINKLPFIVNGVIEHSAKRRFVDLHVEGNQMPLGAFVHELPEDKQQQLDDYKLNGILIFNADIKGSIENGKEPEVKANYQLKNGSIIRKSSNLELKNVSFTGSYTNGKWHSPATSKIELKEFKANLNIGVISGSLVYENFNHPVVDMKLDAKLALSELVDFLKWEAFENASGDIDLDFRYRGKLKYANKIVKADFLHSKTNGELKIRDVNLKLSESSQELKNISGDFRFDNNDLITDMLKAEINGNRIEATGYFTNLLSFLLLENERLWADLSVKAEKIDLDKLLRKYPASSGEQRFELRLPKIWGGNLDMQIAEFKFGKFNASNVKGNLTLKNEKLIANYFEMNSMAGKMSMKGYLDMSKGELNPVVCDALLENMNIRQTFEDLNNFGQDKLMSENIKGKVTSKVKFESRIDRELNISMDHLYAKADVMIENGELIDYKPLQRLSKFIKVEDLSRIKFSTLKNQIEIKNKKIHIPQMEINSNAINLEISGDHTLNNEIDYKLRILLSDILWKKARNAKRENSEFGVIEDDGIRTSLYMKITGTVDNPEFKYDRKQVAKKIISDIKKEKESLKKLFKEEFHWFVRDSVKKELRKEKEQKIQKEKQEQNEFIIEWEEDSL